MRNIPKSASLPPLPGPFAIGDTPQMAPSPAVSRLAGSQVVALLSASPAFHELPLEKQDRLRRDMAKIATYSASLIQDEWANSEKLGQTPVLHTRTTLVPGQEMDQSAKALAESTPVARAAANQKKTKAAEEFDPRAASQVAKVTRDTLNAIAFPTFVADLIKGTFNAIVDASIQQMEAYGELLSNVAKTVDQFMGDNISDNNARDFLVAKYPGHFRVDTGDEEGPRVRVRDNADDLAKPDFKGHFQLNEDVDLDDDAVEQVLVPAARRQLARNRHSLLSTMVLMGINRIVVTSGRIRAKMGFRIDAHDHGRAESASQFDFQHSTSVGAGGGIASFFGGPSVQSKTSVAYVSSTKKESSDDLNVNADLTGEVDLKFKSDYFPMERFAKPEMMALIQGHTPNPEANKPNTGSGAGNSGEQAPSS